MSIVTDSRSGGEVSERRPVQASGVGQNGERVLSIQTFEAGDVTVMRPLSELTAEVGNQWRSQFHALIPGRGLVVDLDGVPFMDSAGLGVLIGGIRRVREGGGEVALAATQPAMRRLLRITGLDKIVEVSDCAEEARHRLDGAHPTP